MSPLPPPGLVKDLRGYDPTLRLRFGRHRKLWMVEKALPVRHPSLAQERPNPLGHSPAAKDVFDAMWRGECDGNADIIIESKGLKQISDTGEIEQLIAGILAANPQQVADYRNGKEKAFNSLVGQAMKATKGKANPAQVNELLKKKLTE